MTFVNRLLMASAAGIALALPGSASAAPAPAKLERVVMLMRHGIRPPTKAQPVPAKYGAQAWPGWSVEPGLLTHRGAAGVALLGAADRSYLVRAGLLPARGCPAAGAIAVHASGKQRAIRTAEEWSARLAPGCALTVEHPSETGADPIFHGLDEKPVGFDGDRALKESLALAPPGGLEAEARAHAGEIALLERVLGCVAPKCDLEGIPTALVAELHDRPEMEGPLDIGSTASQSFLLEYLEGMPMKDVGWGRVTRPEIERLLAFHPVKFRYSNRAPYIARTAAAPLITAMVRALTTDGAKVTLLAGHDTNVADLAGLLDLHWHIPSYPADDTPPGGAIGFELWRGAKGGQYVRAFYRAQSMDQLRNLTPLDGKVGPTRQYIAVPGCGTVGRIDSCPLGTFTKLVDARLAAR